jgi:predicted dehydrogenase
MFCRPIVNEYADVAALVGLCDVNQIRMDYINGQLGTSIPTFKNFDEMLQHTKPDTVIVTSKDSTHHEFIVRALESGCDVVTEKPMTIDDGKCRAILAAEKKTGRKVIVTFNYRFSPRHTKIKELIQGGTIGKVLSVDFHWYLDTSHGADYFRRWHRRKENSGGLLVHKATHHFDLVNWFLDTEPEEVFAYGKRAFYGPTRQERGERCLTCGYKRKCRFYFDLKSNDELREFYLDAESEDGYIRDGCVFADEIDIYDTMVLAVRYKNGVHMSYSLNAFMPYEGYRIALNGMGGRLEIMVFEQCPWATPPPEELRFIPLFGKTQVIPLPHGGGGHAGGDELMRDAIFRGKVADPLNHMADSRAGAMSILTGIAANRAIESGHPVRIEDLLQGGWRGCHER